MSVALVGTLDTKGPEYAFLRDRLLAEGVDVLVVDAGVHEPVGIRPDVDRAEVARAAGADVSELAQRGDRGAAVEAMGAGAEAVVLQLHGEGRVDGVLALGGSGGSSIATRGDARAAGRRAEADGLDRSPPATRARTSARST